MVSDRIRTVSGLPRKGVRQPVESGSGKSGATREWVSGWRLNVTNQINHASNSRDPAAQTSKSIVHPGDCPQLRAALQHGGRLPEAGGSGWHQVAAARGAE